MVALVNPHFIRLSALAIASYWISIVSIFSPTLHIFSLLNPVKSTVVTFARMLLYRYYDCLTQKDDSTTRNRHLKRKNHVTLTLNLDSLSLPPGLYAYAYRNPKHSPPPSVLTLTLTSPNTASLNPVASVTIPRLSAAVGSASKTSYSIARLHPLDSQQQLVDIFPKGPSIRYRLSVDHRSNKLDLCRTSPSHPIQASALSKPSFRPTARFRSTKVPIVSMDRHAMSDHVANLHGFNDNRPL
jgi:hypothetical protein